MFRQMWVLYPRSFFHCGCERQNQGATKETIIDKNLKKSQEQKATGEMFAEEIKSLS